MIARQADFHALRDSAVRARRDADTATDVAQKKTRDVKKQVSNARTYVWCV
jgi:hypothetical protein